MDLFDQAHAKHRVNDPETSKVAANKVNPTKGQQFLLEELAVQGEKGATIKEICTKHNLQMSSYSSRASELENRKDIFYRGDCRKGARIMRLAKFDTGRRICRCGLVLCKIDKGVCPECKV